MRQRARMTARARSRRVYASPDRENENRFHEKKHRQNWPKMALKTQDPSSSHSPNLSQRNGTRSISVRFLDTASRRRGFARGFSRELFSRGFATGGFTSSLFGTSHCSVPHSLFYDDYIWDRMAKKREERRRHTKKEPALRTFVPKTTPTLSTLETILTNYQILNIHFLLDYFHVFIPHRFNHILESVGVRALENTRLRIRVEGSARAQNLFQFRHQLFRWVY